MHKDIANTRQNKNIKEPQKKYRIGTVKISFSRSNGDWVPYMKAEVQFMRAAKTGESAHLHRLAWASATRKCNNGTKISCWQCVCHLWEQRRLYLRRLAWAFDTQQCDKYHNLICWLKWRFECHICGQRMRWQITFAHPCPMQQYLNIMCWLTWWFVCHLCKLRKLEPEPKQQYLYIMCWLTWWFVCHLCELRKLWRLAFSVDKNESVHTYEYCVIYHFS